MPKCTSAVQFLFGDFSIVTIDDCFCGVQVCNIVQMVYSFPARKIYNRRTQLESQILHAYAYAVFKCNIPGELFVFVTRLHVGYEPQSFPSCWLHEHESWASTHVCDEGQPMSLHVRPYSAILRNHRYRGKWSNREK